MSGRFVRSAALFAALSAFAWAGASEDAALLEEAHDGATAALANSLSERFSAEELAKGVHVSRGPQFLFAVRSAERPTLHIDDAPATATGVQLEPRDLWVFVTELETGRSHAFQFFADGKELGPRTDVRAYTADHYVEPGIPQGEVFGPFEHTSEIYPGMTSTWWYYVSPGVGPEEPAALMVWQDGQKYAGHDQPSRLLEVTENLVAEKRIPPLVHLLIQPGMVGDQRMRSIEYDTVDDSYVRFVTEEILPLAERRQKIRSDAYSRAIAGESSGGIASLNAAWQRPDLFARVLSRIGSYTAIAWRSKAEKGDDLLVSGHTLPFLVRKADKRNIRVWMEDGAMDLENSHGSWPLQNIQLANSLKMREYDFRFRFGNAQHNTTNGDSMLPEALSWLWRDYDPSKTEQAFEMDPAEREKPYFRVERLNRSE